MNAGHLAPAIVVTGASSGLGREFARLAIEDGVALVLVGRSESALAELLRELSARRAASRILKLSIDLQRADASHKSTPCCPRTDFTAMFWSIARALEFSVQPPILTPAFSCK